MLPRQTTRTEIVMCWLNEASVVSKEFLSDCYQQEANLRVAPRIIRLTRFHDFIGARKREENFVTSTHVVTSRTLASSSSLLKEQCTDHHLLVFLTGGMTHIHDHDQFRVGNVFDQCLYYTLTCCAAQTGTLYVPKKNPNNTYYVQLFCD